MNSAYRPCATNESCGFELRSAPGHVRKVSAIRPMPRVGVTHGSNAGIVSRMICHHASGTGGCCQYDGSEYSPECAGMINVTSGVITSNSACTTATDPPFTHP